MSTVEKVLMGIVGIGMVTTLILPKRQTPAVVGAFGSAFSKVLGKAMGEGVK